MPSPKCNRIRPSFSSKSTRTPSLSRDVLGFRLRSIGIATPRSRSFPPAARISAAANTTSPAGMTLDRRSRRSISVLIAELSLSFPSVTDHSSATSWPRSSSTRIRRRGPSSLVSSHDTKPYVRSRSTRASPSSRSRSPASTEGRPQFASSQPGSSTCCSTSIR